MDVKTRNVLEEAYQKSKDLKFKEEDWLDAKWEEIKDPKRYGKHGDTGVDLAVLREIGNKITVLPPEDKFHPVVNKIYQARNDSINSGTGIDFGTAEALAFATLVDDGNHVRITGEDCERGVHNTRHAHVFYQDRDGHYTPINAIADQHGARTFTAGNSLLSEHAVLGFECGYA